MIADEFALYSRDPAKWAALVAPRWVPMLERSEDERTLAMWRMARAELKREVWALAGDELKERIRRLADANPAA